MEFSARKLLYTSFELQVFGKYALVEDIILPPFAYSFLFFSLSLFLSLFLFFLVLITNNQLASLGGRTILPMFLVGYHLFLRLVTEIVNVGIW